MRFKTGTQQPPHWLKFEFGGHIEKWFWKLIVNNQSSELTPGSFVKSGDWKCIYDIKI